MLTPTNVTEGRCRAMASRLSSAAGQLVHRVVQKSSLRRMGGGVDGERGGMTGGGGGQRGGAGGRGGGARVGVEVEVGGGG